MTVFLLGMPGSGKTTLGQALAEHLQCPFFDTDELIASMEDMSISEIFNTYGEAHFRQLEKELITNWKISHAVIATGGGLPCHNNLISVLKEKGKTIWLQVSIEKLCRRLSTAQDIRPMFSGLKTNEINSKLNKMYKERKSFYQQSEIRVKIQDEVSQSVRKILSKIYQ